MLTQIDLNYFKCFEFLKLPLQPLTLLSGANASGKSTVLQAIVLLHQTMCEQERSVRLLLNGNTVQLGTVFDVVDQVNGKNIFKIALCDNDEWYRWKFEGEKESTSMVPTKLNVNGMLIDSPTSLHHLLPLMNALDSLPIRLRDLTYLTAERLGPREFYPLNDLQLAPGIGSTGENAVSILYSSRDKRVLDRLAIEQFPPALLHQVEARMALFFPNFKIQLDKVPQTNNIALGICTTSGTEFHRPVHAGFGVTQVLPLVVAALSADRESILLIENPEVHLHPAGQAAIGKFLAEIASAGVQVILESHSDHVLSGIRRAVKEGVLRSEDVALHFFRPRFESEKLGLSQVQSPALDASGNIDHWPEGFFDQFDKDNFYFAGWD